MSLGTAANYAQIVSLGPLFTGVVVLYWHHRCHHCWRWGRFKVGPHQMPCCNAHRSFGEERIK